MMRKFGILLMVFGLLFSFQSSATHIQGGEITWKCLSNGQYQFYLKVYRECGVAQFSFTDQTLRVLGSAGLSSITMKPDNAEFTRLNNGNISPKNAKGEKALCNNSSDPGVVQAFPFYSDPVTLTGVPPANGWTFYWSICCRASTENIAGQSMFYLRATMFPFQNQPADVCFDSSPEFAAYPTTYIVAEIPYTINHNAMDADLDSLVYEYDDPLQGLNSPTSWKTGYSKTSPFPSTFQDPNNIGVSLDDVNGQANGLIANRNFSLPLFTYSVRVDSYRKGVKIASIWRDMNVNTITQANLNTSQRNDLPDIYINGNKTTSLTISTIVGDWLSIPVLAIDTNKVLDDPNDPNSLRSQDVLLTAKSKFFSTDYMDSLQCPLSGKGPCATLNPAPDFDTTINTIGLLGTESVSTVFEWQPSCDLFETGENKKTFDFVFSAVDDHTPSLQTFSTLTIEVSRKTPEIIQNGNVLTVLDTGNSYQWFKNDTLIPNSDTSSILIHETGMYSLKINGNIACNYQKGYYEVIGCTIINDTLSACNSLTWRDGITYTQSTTSPTFILPNSNGCDTVVKLNLIILKSESVDKVTSCTAYSWIDGNTYTQSTNTPQFILTNSAGCDSIITLNLLIPAIDTSINRNQNILQANQLNATYQWLDCENAFAEIPGETGRNFSPIENGIYTCEITKDGCKDTTECFSFYFIGLEERFTEGINIYPNPSKGNFIVELSDEIKSDIELKMMDINGREVQVEIVRSNKQLIIQASPTLVKGIYFLNLRSKQGQANFKIVKL